MAALMRFSRFSSVVKHIPKLTCLCNASVPRVTAIQGKSKGVQRVYDLVSARALTTDSAAAVETSASELSKSERLIQTVEGNIRRYGRIESHQLLAVVAHVEKEGQVSKQNSLVILQSLGSQLYNEHPDTRVKMTLEIWDKLQQIGEFDERHYNALLRAHLENGYDFSPTKFLADMEGQNVSPNRVTYQRLIAQYCQQGDMGAATQILDHMKQVDLPINEYVFKAFIKGHFKAGDPDNAKETLNIMRQAGIEPSGDTYSAVFCGFAEMGNYEAIRQCLLDAESEGVMLRPHHILDVIFSLTKSGHHDYIDQMIDLLNKGPGYSHNAIKYANQMVAHGYDDIAYKLYLGMPKPTQMDKQESTSGRFLLRALTKFERPLDKVSDIVKDMKEKNYNKDDLGAIPLMAYINKSTEYALEAIEKMKEEGLPVRSHYFCPAICQYRDRNNAQGIYSSLTKMVNMCETHNDFMQTLHGYAVPALMHLEGSMEDIKAKLLEIGFEGDEINFAFFLWYLKQEGPESALKYGEDASMLVITGGLRPCVINALQDGGSWEALAKVLHMCDVKSGKGQMLRDVNGTFVFEMIKLNKKKTDWNAVGEVLDYLKEKEMMLPNHVMRDLQGANYLTDAPGHLIEKLESLQVAGGQSRSSVEQANFAEMSQEDLKAILEKQDDHKKAQKWLLIKSCQSGDVQQAEELNAKLKDEGFVLPPIALKQLAFLYAYHTSDLEKAQHWLNRLRTEFPDYSTYAKVVVNIAGLLAEKGKSDEALEMLNTYASQCKGSVQELSNTYDLQSDCELMLKRASLTDPTLAFNLLESLFQLGYIRKPCFSCYEAYMDGVLLRENDEDLLTAVEKVSTTFGHMPRLNDVCKYFINKEDPDALQKVVDQATPVMGEMNVLNSLIVSFVECGHPKKARKIVEMPGFRAMMRRLIYGCDKFVIDGKVQEMEQLVEITKDVFSIDRDEMLFQLIRCHVKQQDMAKAMNVLTMYEEENARTSDRTLRYLAKVLDGQNMPVPFEVPAVKPRVQAIPEAAELSQSENGLLDCVLNNNGDLFAEKLKSCDQSSVRKVLTTLSSKENHEAIRRLFMLLGDAGELAMLKKIESEKAFPQSTSHRLRSGIFKAHVTNNTLDDLVKYLKQNVAELPYFITEHGVFQLGNKSPQHLEELEALVFQAADAASGRLRLNPVNILWSYHYVNQSPKAGEILQKYPDLLKTIHVMKVCREFLSQNKTELLTPLRSLLKEHNTRSLAIVHDFLLRHQCDQSDSEGILSEYTQLQADQLQITDLNKITVRRAKEVLEAQNKTIPWEGSSVDQADSSDSSDSSDDEKR